MKFIKHFAFILLFSSVLASCSTFKTVIYDQYSYQKTVEIKVEASNLMEKATTPYINNLKEIGELGLEIQKIIEYEKSKPNNDITYAMWQILGDKDRNLLTGFFKRWKEKEKLNPIFIKEAKLQIIEAMDLLIQYESKKNKGTKNKLLQLINNN